MGLSVFLYDDGLGVLWVNICECNVTDDCGVAFICAGEAYIDGGAPAAGAP